MTVQPASRDKSIPYLESVHRHHGRVTGWKFGLWLLDGPKTCGLVVVGHPQSRELHLREPLTAEVLRLCTDGTYNACSYGYAAAAKVARAMGYTSIITYILASETGASLRAAGWSRDRNSDGGTWDRPSRGRSDKHPTEPKVRWRKDLA